MTSTEDAKDDDWGDEDGIKVEAVKLDIDVAPENDVEGDEQNVMIRVKVPETAGGDSTTLERTASGSIVRSAVDVCCVIDISGSMGSIAKYDGPDGTLIDDGFEYLDIVKYAVKAVIKMLKPHDRFSLVVFDDRAEVPFELGNMTPEGKEAAIAVLESQAPRGMTDTWLGLRTGMESLRNAKADEGWRQKFVLLLTDGLPNNHPPKGYIPELKSYKESHPDFSFQLNTFGFGYQLDSKLLLDLATEGNGTFAFLPDALLVGTALLNSVCNSLSTQTQNATLHLMPQGGAQLTGPVLGVDQSMVVDASWGRVVSLGPLQFGQSREIVAPMKIPVGDAPYLQAVVVFPGPDGKEARSEFMATCRTGSVDAKVAVCRGKVVDAGYLATLTGVGGDVVKGSEVLATAIASIETMFPDESETPENLKALKTDIDGRMTKSLNGSDRFNRWGKHYLYAITRAHQLQFCTNYLDPGLQVYGGMFFKSLRDEGEVVFQQLGAPTRRVTRTAPAPQSGYSGSAPRPSTPPTPSYYTGGGGGG